MVYTQVIYGYFMGILPFTCILQAISGPHILNSTESSLPFLIDLCATESWNPPEENGEDPGDGEHDVRPVQGPLVVGEREADGLWEGNKKRDFDFDLGVCLSIGHAIPLSNFQLPTKPF